MIYDDPRADAPEIVEDQKKSQDTDNHTKPEKVAPKDDYRYTDWASI
jgi:hypothetical protein